MKAAPALPPAPSATNPPAEAAPVPSSLPAKLPWVLLTALSLPAALLAVSQLGRIHPDEVYQALEPAYWRVHQYGVLAWEWQVGLRNWFVPLVLAGFLRLCALLHIDHPVAYRAVLELPQFALHLASLAAVYRYTLRRTSKRAATWATMAVALYGPVLTFAGRTMSESISTSVFLLAVDFLDRERATKRDALYGGLALGFTVVARYGSAVLVLGALLWLLAHRRRATLAFVVLGGSIVAAGLAVLDWQTWGSPFHSFLKYVDFNIVSGQGARQFGSAPASFYLPALWSWTSLWLWPGLFFAWKRDRARLSLPLASALLYLAVILLTAHKEERFLYPGLVLLALAAAPPLFAWVDALNRTDLRNSLVTLVLCASFAPFFWMPELRADQFRAIVKATRPREVTGLLIVNEGIWGAGGSFYIGKRIPWGVCDWAADGNFQAAMANPVINRVVTFEGRELETLQSRGFRILEQVGRETILGR